MNENLSVTAEQVRKAADKCPTAKEVLKELFPTAFKKEIDLSKLKIGGRDVIGYLFDDKSIFDATGKTSLIDIRIDRDYKNKGFWLSDQFEWKIIKDGGGVLVLVPTLK